MCRSLCSGKMWSCAGVGRLYLCGDNLCDKLYLWTVLNLNYTMTTVSNSQLPRHLKLSITSYGPHWGKQVGDELPSPEEVALNGGPSVSLCVCWVQIWVLQVGYCCMCVHACVCTLTISDLPLAGCLFPFMSYGGIDAQHLEWSWAHRMRINVCGPLASLRHFKTIWWYVCLLYLADTDNKSVRNIRSWLLYSGLSII